MTGTLTSLTEIELFALLRHLYGFRVCGPDRAALVRATRKLFNQYGIMQAVVTAEGEPS